MNGKFDTADALDRFRMVKRGAAYTTLFPSDAEEAIAALEEKIARDNPRPLTLDELRERDGKPVFAIDGEGHKCWVVVNTKEECCADNEFGSWHMYFYNMKNADSDTLHNMGWLAYDHEPKEEKA